MRKENIYAIRQGCQRQCYTRMHFFIFEQIDSEKTQLVLPLWQIGSTVWIISFSVIDHSSHVLTPRGVRHIKDSGQCWEDKASFFHITVGEYYIVWNPGSLQYFSVSGNVTPRLSEENVEGLNRKPTTQLFIWICGPGYIFTTSMSIDHRCCQLWSIDCL